MAILFFFISGNLTGDLYLRTKHHQFKNYWQLNMINTMMPISSCSSQMELFHTTTCVCDNISTKLFSVDGIAEDRQATEWSTRSPDLFPLYYSLWGHLHTKNYASQPKLPVVLQHRISAVITFNVSIILLPLHSVQAFRFLASILISFLVFLLLFRILLFVPSRIFEVSLVSSFIIYRFLRYSCTLCLILISVCDHTNYWFLILHLSYILISYPVLFSFIGFFP